MHTTTQAEKLLKERNMKLTWQRVLIADYLLRHPGHWSADEIYHGLESEDHDLARATVYNTLRVLTESGALRALDTSQSEKRYDIIRERHAHSVCEQCGKIKDIRLPQDFDAQKRQMDDDGFDYRDLQLIFYGICKDCQKMNEESSRP